MVYFLYLVYQFIISISKKFPKVFLSSFRLCKRSVVNSSIRGVYSARDPQPKGGRER